MATEWQPPAYPGDVNRLRAMGGFGPAVRWSLRQSWFPCIVSATVGVPFAMGPQTCPFQKT